MPPPPNDTENGYPQGWALDQWPSNPIGSPFYLRSIEADSSIPLAQTALTLNDFPNTSAITAVKTALTQFPSDPSSLFTAHLNYYNSLVHQLGAVLWAPQPTVHTIGIDERYISTFLYNLNSTPDLSGAKEYAIAGDSNSFYLLLNGPYSIANDGVVPEASALGTDPLTQLSLISDIFNSSGQTLSYDYNHVVMPVNHLDLTGNSQVINQVITWLLADE